MNNLPSIQKLFDLSGKTALVTGGAMGIGEGIAFRLAQAGANVMISDINPTAGQEAVRQMQEFGGRVEFLETDSADYDSIRRVTDRTVERFGSLDILVNNAGIFPSRPILDIDPVLWKKVIDLNLSGLFYHTQAAAKVMVNQGKGGRIINIASIDAFHPTGNLVHYDSSKGGVVMMTRSTALELGKHKINVNAIAPGAIATPGASGGTPTGMTQEQMDAILKSFTARIPVGRMGVPDDIAKVALFLASPAADYITGETIIVDGGYLLS